MVRRAPEHTSFFGVAPAELRVGRRSAAQVVESWRGLHFRRKPAVERQLQLWSSEALRHAIARIQAGILETRRLSDLDHAIAGKTLLDLARAAKR